MVFEPPSWVPKLPFDPPDSIPIAEFMTTEKYARYPLAKSRNPFTCGLTGKTYDWNSFIERQDCLARAIGKRLGWLPNEETEWDKVACIFSVNTVQGPQTWPRSSRDQHVSGLLPGVAVTNKNAESKVTISWAIHRLNGIVTPANAAYSAPELTHQLKSSGAKALFVGGPQLQIGLEAAKAAGIPKDKIWLMGMPGLEKADGFVTVEDLIAEGAKLSPLDALQWRKGQGERQPAFLSYSSGTSGLPKAVMVSHRNVIANAMQHVAYESVSRKKLGISTQTVLGLLPLSHIYALVVIAHNCTYRGDEVVVLPKFEMPTYLSAIERFKINHLFLVPPIVIRMTRVPEECKKYNLDSVRVVFSGAAPLGEETIQDMNKIWPKWRVAQGYGMTETATIVTSNSEDDILNKSSGSLLPATRAKIFGLDGTEVKGYDTPGELWVQSPSATIGYLNNQKATTETFVFDEDGRWVRTGDEAVVTLAPSGNEHIVIVDRIKELIKVKGHQVAPAELEAHLLSHPAVADCAVIQVPDDSAGEVPKAFVVKAPAFADKPEDEVVKAILKHVEEHKASYKWIKGGIEFLDVVPKSPSGKILRRLLRDQEKTSRTKKGPKL